MDNIPAVGSSRRRVIQGVAWFDLAVTLPFALPFVAEFLLAFIYRIDAQLGFFTPPGAFGPLQMMFVHIMGVLGVIWALARVREPSETLARIDGLGRVMVAALILHAINGGATPVLAIFMVTELAGSVAQLLGSRRVIAARR